MKWKTCLCPLTRLSLWIIGNFIWAFFCSQESFSCSLFALPTAAAHHLLFGSLRFVSITDCDCVSRARLRPKFRHFTASPHLCCWWSWRVEWRTFLVLLLLLGSLPFLWPDEMFALMLQFDCKWGELLGGLTFVCLPFAITVIFSQTHCVLCSLQ